MASEGIGVENSPTWAVAIVCSCIVVISLAFERSLHFLGKFLKRKNQKSLYEALLKIKEELMLLGFISLLLAVFQSIITNRICIPKDLANKWLPCKNKEESKHPKTTLHFESFISPHRLLAEASTSANKCTLKISRWKSWEESASQKEHDAGDAPQTKITHVHGHNFIKRHFVAIGKRYDLLGWLHSFVKQFYGSVNEDDYTTLRRGFIKNHCKGNPEFNFHKYMMRAFEADFKKVVGISWYLWLFVNAFFILNDWKGYFWVAVIPFILLLAVGTKLEHIITQLANEIAEKHEAIEGDLIVKPSDDHFWFHRPRLILILIKIILFQNSLEIAFFFWIWFQYKFHSCIMGQVDYMVARLIIRVFVQVLCSFSTLPLYALVSHMGSSFNKDGIFDEPVQEGLVNWAKEAKRNMAMRKAAKIDTNLVNNMAGSSSVTELELGKVDDHEDKELSNIFDGSDGNIGEHENEEPIESL
ncbi:MLO-like protein 1 isoform X2 [Mangifera indica]|uniref:MLO-like protein 1 isoform X2 n=1 Tax=Mangifera indica TaxID=29780 RepID=UPI001CFBF757|nr:MLO-like protein 1 isoform X2 [Mangifera indica]